MRRVLCVMLVLSLATGMVVLPVSPVSVMDDEVVCRAAATNSPSKLDLLYSVTVEQGTSTVHVDLDVQGLLESELRVGFYRVTTDIHYCISNLSAEANGALLPSSYFGDNAWTIVLGAGPAAPLHVSYDIARLVLESNPFTPAGSDVANVLITDEGGMLIGNSFFLVPLELAAARIRVKFDLPAGWQVVCPYDDCGTYFQVVQTTPDLISNFVQRKGISLGKLRWYSEEKVGNCTVKFGVLEADQSWDTALHLGTQADVDFYVHRTAQAVQRFADIFGENPYHVMLMYTNFCADVSGTYYYYGGNAGMFVGGCQYWPPERYDELTGHLLYEWYGFPNTSETLVSSVDFISKGLGESYLGCKMAYDLTGDPVYLGKFYQYYLVYKRALDTPYMLLDEVRNKYYKGGVAGLYLDSLVQKETQKRKSIYDVFSYLYRKYRNSSHCISTEDVEEAVNTITAVDNSVVFDKYIYGDQEIPVEEDIEPYRDSFGRFLSVLDSDAFGKAYHSSPIPFFVDLEMAVPLAHHIPFGLLCDEYYRSFAKYIFANYAVDTLTQANVEFALQKLTGQDCTGFFDRWKDSYGELTIGEMKEWLKSYMPYIPQGLTAVFHGTTGVELKWNAVQPRYSSNYDLITGYAIYRGTSPGTEVLLAHTSKSGAYTDTSAVAGQTYYYYVESIADQPLGDGRHINSEPSAEVVVVCKDTVPPFLTVMSPDDGATVATGSVVVAGTATDDGVGMASTTINGATVGLASGGSFSMAVNLSEGLNEITILATDKAGNQATQTLKIDYVKPAQTVTVVLHVGQTSFTVNGAPSTLDSPPVIKNGRTLLPIRAVIESLGGTVAWDGNERKATVAFGTRVVELWIGQSQALVDGNAIAIDASNAKVVPEIINGRTMLPLRFVGESLGFDVQWDPLTRGITISGQ